LGIDPQAIEDEGELVDERDVEVALGVLDDFGRLRDPNTTDLVGTGGDDASVQGVDEVGNLGGGTGGYLLDRGQPVFFVAGIDALRAVADEEIPVELEFGYPLQDGDADLLRSAGVDRGLVDDNVTHLQ